MTNLSCLLRKRLNNIQVCEQLIDLIVPQTLNASSNLQLMILLLYLTFSNQCLEQTQQSDIKYSNFNLSYKIQCCYFHIKSQHLTIKLIIISPICSQYFLQVYGNGRDLSSDEQDASFQGRHEGKQTVTHKQSCDVLLINSICEAGYTINFYPQNVAAPRNGWSKIFSSTLTHCFHDRYFTRQASYNWYG